MVEARLWLDSVDCPACLVVSRAQALRRARVTYDRYPEFLSRLARLVESGRTIAFVESFALVTELAGSNPYSELKEKLNNVLLEVLEKIRDIVAHSLIDGLEAAAAANAVDIEMLEYRFSGNLASALTEKPRYVWCTRSNVAELVEAAENIAYVVDNAGEIIVDLLVASMLAERGKKVTIYTRSYEYETDVTESEVKQLIRKLNISLRVVGSGSRYPPHHPMSMTRKDIEKHDLIILKGIANYEAFLEAPISKPTLILLRAKCGVLARHFNVPLATPVITLLR